MLKIKDNVDLKELEKFGFKYKDYGDDCPFWEYDMKDNRTYLIIDTETREIGIPTALYGDLPNRYISNFNVVYDLIKADLVEKEEENKIEKLKWNVKSQHNCTTDKTQATLTQLLSRTEQLKKSLNELIDEINKLKEDK